MLSTMVAFQTSIASVLATVAQLTLVMLVVMHRYCVRNTTHRIPGLDDAALITTVLASITELARISCLDDTALVRTILASVSEFTRLTDLNHASLVRTIFASVSELSWHSGFENATLIPAVTTCITKFTLNKLASGMQD